VGSLRRVYEGARTPPPRGVSRASRTMDWTPVERSWRRSPRGSPRGRRSIRLGPSRSLALALSGGSLKWSSRVTVGTFEGLRGAPSGRLRVPPSDRSRASHRGGFATARGRWLERPSSVPLLVSERRLECPRAWNRRVATGPSCLIRRPTFGPAPRGPRRGRATLCDSRLRSAGRRVECKTRTWRRSGDAPGRENGLSSAGSSICRPR